MAFALNYKKGLFLLLISILFTQRVFSDTLQVNITGNIVASSCTVDNNGTYEVDLGQNIPASRLASPNSFSDWKTFSVTLRNCTAGMSNVTATFSGTADSKNNKMYANATGSSYAKNVAVQVQNTVNYSEMGDGSIMTTSVNSNVATFPLQARVYSTSGGATVGSISTAVLMTFSYN